MTKMYGIKDDNKSVIKLSCGYVLNGNESKRRFVAKVHKKKCSFCSHRKIDDMVYIPSSNEKKVDYLSYMRGETQVERLDVFSVPAPTANES